ncbi:MAG: RNA polymerase sigma-70 factor, partial [Bacteroidia bacterium]
LPDSTMIIHSDSYSWTDIKNGNEPAFEHFFKLHYSELCRFAFSFLGDKDEAEEMVQQVFFNLWAKREAIQLSSSLRAYLFSAVRNKSLNRIEHAQVKLMHEKTYLRNESSHADEAAKKLLQKELNELIKESIDALPEQCRLVFGMSRFENLKYAEIAEQLGISIKTVEKHMGRALKELRERLKDYHMELILLFLLSNSL